MYFVYNGLVVIQGGSSFAVEIAADLGFFLHEINIDISAVMRFTDALVRFAASGLVNLHGT
jgi:hypothetical protein